MVWRGEEKQRVSLQWAMEGKLAAWRGEAKHRCVTQKGYGRGASGLERYYSREHLCDFIRVHKAINSYHLNARVKCYILKCLK
ncbi:hypothetical protein SK128_015019 [Halocaridina rubra]|uniref:Uncharacterized protein n=1 Tax=Halocaridina rubra TaxID=373956 RepID=A0AAN8ZU35_HALRR